MKKFFLTVIFSLWGLIGVSQVCLAGSDSVFTAEVKADFETTYTKVYKALEQNKFFVIFEPDIGANLSGFAERWGKDYNQNKLEGIKSMVFCNGWYANQVSNADPDMLALCPLSITMTHKDGMTRVLFIRPDRVARGTKAENIAGELTRGVIEAINEGLK